MREGAAMLQVRDRKTAEHFGILDRSAQVRIDLMESEVTACLWIKRHLHE